MLKAPAGPRAERNLHQEAEDGPCATRGISREYRDPWVVLDMSEVLVIAKPPGWEVYDGNAERQLADYLVNLQRGRLPILTDLKHGCGSLGWLAHQQSQRGAHWRIGVPIIHSRRDQKPPPCDSWYVLFVGCFFVSLFLLMGPMSKRTQSAKRPAGFIHRLDVPSSGLVIAATTYHAWYDLQFQLVTGTLLRECRGTTGLVGWSSFCDLFGGCPPKE